MDNTLFNVKCPHCGKPVHPTKCYPIGVGWQFRIRKCGYCRSSYQLVTLAFTTKSQSRVRDIDLHNMLRVARETLLDILHLKKVESNNAWDILFIPYKEITYIPVDTQGKRIKGKDTLGKRS